jgi:hypothetical protein
MTSKLASTRAAAQRPWPSGSCFCLLNVFNPYPFTAAPIFIERLKERVLQNLEAAAQTLRDVGWDATTEICLGMPAGTSTNSPSNGERIL